MMFLNPPPPPSADADAVVSLTPWFPGDVHPVMDGVYQRRNSLGMVMYSYWDGTRWHWNRASAELAVMDRDASLAQALPWRGLAAPPVGGYGRGTPEEASC